MGKIRGGEEETNDGTRGSGSDQVMWLEDDLRRKKNKK